MQNPGFGASDNAKASEIDERHLWVPCVLKLATATRGRPAGLWHRRSRVQPPRRAAAPEMGHVQDRAGSSACLIDCGSLRLFVPLRSSALTPCRKTFWELQKGLARDNGINF